MSKFILALPYNYAESQGSSATHGVVLVQIISLALLRHPAIS